VYNLLAKYNELFQVLESNRAFLGIEQLIALQNEIDFLEKRLVKWVITEDIDIKILSPRLRTLVAEKLLQIKTLEDIGHHVQNSKDHNMLWLLSLEAEPQGNFQTTAMDFVAKIQNDNITNKERSLQQLYIFSL
jgi:hypothetical protein